MARSDLSKVAREAAAKSGTALRNGKYPIRNRRELGAAIKLRHHSIEPYATVRAHIARRAAALGIKLKASQVASAGPGTVVFACHSKACAPPPVGKGGSTKGSGKITLYRGEGELNRPSYYPKTGPDAGLAGAWWTSDRKSAEQYAKSQKGRVYQIDVNASEAEPRGARGNYVILDPEVRKRRVLSHPVITATEARGDSKPVSRKEFQRLASIGQVKLDAMSANSSPIKLSDNWNQVKADSYREVTKSWGGATIDAHTGRALPQGANKFALTVKEKGGDTVSIPENASRAQFDTAMDLAKKRFRPILEREGHHLGVFHDDDLGRIDIDPVLVVGRLEDVHTIGAATHAIGGAYNFSDGNGYWPPHVAEEG